MLNNLIGYQLLEINEWELKVQKGNNVRTFEFIKDNGGSCGYADINTELFISEDELSRNPVITNVVEDDTDTTKSGYANVVTFTLLGETKKLAIVCTECGSGSGWSYGSSVTLKCVETREEEIINEW